ncbi:MAG: DnaA ATPase domain-containing protein [Mailhella sp.]
MKEIWQSILSELRGSLPEGKVKVFLEPLKGDVVKVAHASRSGGQGLLIEPAPAVEWEVRLTAMNDFMASQVRDQFSQAVAQVASSLLGGKARVVVKAASARKKTELPPPASIEQLAASIPTAPAVLMADKQLDLPLPLPIVRVFNPAVMKGWKHSFEDFVVGPCNQIAYAAASNILEASAPVDMVFLCAGAGLGKTHLTQAVGRALSLEADKRQVRMEYLTAEEFTSQFVQAMKYKTMDQFKERFRDLDMLLLEDVHFLRGKDRTQEELLSTIKNLQDHGGRVVLTSSFAPRDLAGVDSQLVSRFCSGFVASMERPNRDTRLHILQEKARRQCMVLPTRVADLLADRITGDVRLLESCLHNLMLQSQFTGHTVTEEMAMDVIRNVARTSPSLSLEDVVELICRSFDLTPAQLCSKSRRQGLVLARNTAFFLLRKHTDLTLEQIGERFNRKHSTVIKGITAVEREISRHSPLGGQIEHAVSMIERSAMLG